MGGFGLRFEEKKFKKNKNIKVTNVTRVSTSVGGILATPYSWMSSLKVPN